MLKKLQAISGLVFFTFLLLHLFNTWLAAFGSGPYTRVQEALRPIYQAQLIEALILGALIVHIVCGITRRIREEPRETPSRRAKLHRIAAYGLLLVIGGHILAVRGPSWFYGIYPGFEGLAFSMDLAAWYFFPYYFLLATMGFYHGLNGASIALSRLAGTRTLAARTLNRATGVAALATVGALLGMAGLWTDVGNPADSEFAHLYLRIMDDLTP